MTNLWILLKNNWNILLGRLQGKKKRKSTFVASGLLILGVIAIFAFYSYSAYTMFTGLGRAGLGKLVMFHACITVLSCLIIVGVMRTSTNEKMKDSDFLLSLPIKKRDIIIAKTINKYFFDLFFAILLLLPFVILYQIMDHYSNRVLLFGLLLIFILPMLSVGISNILDFIITRVFNRMKFASLIKSLLLVFIFVVILGLLFLKTFFYEKVEFQTMEDYFADRPMSNLLLKFMFDLSFLNIFLVLCLCIIPFIVGLVLYSINFGKSFESFRSTNKNLKFYDGKSAFVMLFKKEISTYVTTTAYIVNTIIGAILILAIGILISSVGIKGMGEYVGTELSKQTLSGIIAIILCCSSAITTISSSSISLEGKNIWILKTSPLSEKTLFLAKAMTHIIIVEPFIVLSSIIMLIALKLSFLQFLMILILPTLITLIMAFGGVLINLWLPLLDWDNETRVVKQSLSVILSMVLGFVIALIPIIIFIIFTSLSINLIFVISLVLYLALLGVILSLLFTIGVKLFKKLD